VAAGLELLSTLGLQGALRELIPAFEGQTEIRLNAAFGPTAVQLERIAGGAMADVAILTAEGIDALIAAGTLLAGSRTDLARSAVGIAVRAGAARPDISSVDAFKRTLLEARSVVYSRAGASGIFFAGLIERLGIAPEVNARATIIPSGFTAERVARGEAEIAVQQISELMEVPGIDIVGALPAEIGSETIFSAGLFASSTRQDHARAFVAFLSTPSAASVIAGSGLAALAATPAAYQHRDITS
jgi:molybdate transport system substrate-binding protein